MAFDTLATARALERAGMDAAQAEAVTEAIGGVVADGVATKADLEPLARGDKVRADLAALELRLTWRILGGVGALLAVAVAVARLLFAS